MQSRAFYSIEDSLILSVNYASAFLFDYMQTLLSQYNYSFPNNCVYKAHSLTIVSLKASRMLFAILF